MGDCLSWRGRRRSKVFIARGLSRVCACILSTPWGELKTVSPMHFFKSIDTKWLTEKRSVCSASSGDGPSESMIISLFGGTWDLQTWTFRPGGTIKRAGPYWLNISMLSFALEEGATSP